MDDNLIAKLRDCDGQLSRVQIGLGIKQVKQSTTRIAGFDGIWALQRECRNDSVPLKFVAIDVNVQTSQSKLIQSISLEVATLAADDLKSCPNEEYVLTHRIQQDREVSGTFRLDTLQEQVVEAITDELRLDVRKRIERACTNEKIIEESKNGSIHTRSIYGDVIIVASSKANMLSMLNYFKFFTPLECVDCTKGIPTRHSHTWSSAVIGLIEVGDLASAHRLRQCLADSHPTILRSPEWKLEPSFEEYPFLADFKSVPSILGLALEMGVQKRSLTHCCLQLMIKYAVHDALHYRSALSLLENDEVAEWSELKQPEGPKRDWGRSDHPRSLPSRVRTAGTLYLAAGRSFQKKLIAAYRSLCDKGDKYKFVRKKHRKWDFNEDTGLTLQEIIFPPDNYTRMASLVRDRGPQYITEKMVAELLKEIGGRQYCDEYHRSLSPTLQPMSLRHMDFTQTLIGVSKILLPVVIERDETAVERLVYIYPPMRFGGYVPESKKSNAKGS